ADQAITVTTHAPASAVYGTSFGVAANAPGGAVAFTGGGGCSNSGNTFTMTSGANACLVHYDQAGRPDYDPPPQVTETVDAQKADLTITAQDRTKVYGDTLNIGTTAFTTSGLVPGDGIESVTLASAGAAAFAAPGTYPIVASAAIAAPGTNLGNY